MTPNNALEFKGRMLSLTRARVVDADLAAITAQLRDFARQMPQAVIGMPIVLEADAPLPLDGVLAALREVGMQPLGVVDGPLADAARELGLAVLPPDTGATRSRPAPAAPAAAAPPPPPPPPVAAQRVPTRVVNDPVRSGQQIYAADGDLVVTSTVSPGAEVVADGCVHLYGTLRGRAIAGARGDTSARIFCRRFEAELVAVAGVYAVAEQMQGDLRGKPAQVVLVDGKLKIEPLDW
ncbi:septum site-determining protein MinC [Solimonas marina]|uniref:Probable septum site-determining protein MinC n=1 Tax=Solimonas marina TaxID=2714601 RepID=A0A969W7E5_9GAMM|nr:septum site-determining protein MinC [Solimonas marina]NKF21328.1 septum site-determining protein MinC [Solimonas marina]